MTITEQLVLSLVRSMTGESGWITPEQIARCALELGRMPGDHRKMQLFCDYFLKGVKNGNLDQNTNGEREVLCRLAPLMPKTVLDVGANEGDWAQMALAELPTAHLHAFEIIPDTFRLLAARLGAEPRVTLNDCGLSDEKGEMAMHVFDAPSKRASHIPHLHGPSRPVTCAVRAGDDYLREKNIAHVDCLKIDVEGAEPVVIQGFAHALGEGRIDLIQFAYGKANIATHFLLYDYCKYFAERGYAVGKIYPDFVDFRDYAYDDEDFLGPNFLACRVQRQDLIARLSARAE
jgi:FkbM family methyltransferase